MTSRIARASRVPTALACCTLAYAALAPTVLAQSGVDASGITLQQAIDAVLEHGVQL